MFPTAILTGLVGVTLLASCSTADGTERESTTTLVAQLAGTPWTQAEPYGIDLEYVEDVEERGFEGVVDVVGFFDLVDNERASGASVRIYFAVFPDYDAAVEAITEVGSGPVDPSVVQRRPGTGQSRFCILFHEVTDECFAVSDNVLVRVVSDLPLFVKGSDPQTEELMALALAHLRSVRAGI